MKTLKNNILISSFIAVLVLFSVIACKGIQEKPTLDGKAFISINVGQVDFVNEYARTILPNSDVTDFTDFVLNMRSSDGKTNTYNFADYESLTSSSIGIETGNWTFTLSSGDFSNTISQTIEEGNNTLNFILDYVGSSNKGTLYVTLLLPVDERIKLVTCGLYNITTELEVQGFEPESLELITNENCLSAVYSSQEVSAGYYIIKWNIYSDQNAKSLLETKKEVVLIDAGITSSDAIFDIQNFPEIYDITYVMNEGSFKDDYVPPYAYTTLSDFDLPKSSKLTKEGQFFEGWYSDEDYTGERINFIKNGSYGDITLYAKWKEAAVNTVEYNTYTDSLEDYIVLDIEANDYDEKYWYLTPGYTYSISWIDLNTSTESMLSDGGYTPIDAKIWVYTEDDDLIASEDDKDSFEFTVSNPGFYKIIVENVDENGMSGNCAYFMYQEETNYSIQYELDNGEFADYYTVPSTYTISEETYLPEGIYVTRPYCIFTGWYETSECNTEPVQRIPAGSYGNKTFYAGWEKELVKIDFVTDYDTAPSTWYIEIGETITAEELPQLSHEGFSFKGWLGEDDYLITSYTVSNNIILTASWVPLYNVVFNTTFGVTPEPLAIEEGESITAAQLPRLSATGKYFMGWYSDSSYSSDKKVSVGDIVESNLTLYAKWGNSSEVADGFVFVEGGTVDSSSYYNDSDSFNWIETSNGTYSFVNNNNNTWTSNNNGIHNSTATTTWTATVTSSVQYTFNYSVSSESGCDRLTIILDGTTIVSSISGSQSSSYTTNLSVGTHTLTATYTKDGSVSTGNDCGTITLDVIGYENNNSYISAAAFPVGRTVTLSDFYISDHEVTQGEYEEFCCYTSSAPSSSYGLGENFPVYYVSWYDAIVYCNLRSIADGLTPCYAMSGETDPRNWQGITNRNGKYSCSYTSSNSAWDYITCNMAANGYRLPTETEWEYAARGGQVTYGTDEFTYYFAGAATSNYSASSNDDLESVGWYAYNTSSTNEVKQKASNALGLYDMSGNVYEWCWDWYSTSVGTGSVTDPCGASSGSYRVRRGGAWNSNANYCSVSRREYSNSYYRGYNDGFRIVSSAPTQFYTITYSTERGTAPEAQKARVISDSQLPEITESGWIFDGWYLDSSYLQEATAGYTLTKAETLYAKWEEYTDDFIFVEGGTVVGSNDYNQYSTGAFPSGRTVNLSSFYISDHEVTQGEYETYCCYTSYSPESTYGNGADYPVYFVSWYDAIVYCNLRSMAAGLNPCYSLSGETDPTKWDGIKNSNGKYSCSYTSSNSTWNSITCDMTANGYRLPTEAEWEYAARGGQESYDTSVFAYYFAGISTTNYDTDSNSDLDSVGWYMYNSDNAAHEIKQKQPNELGLYDMSGNVYEWCWDWYSDSVSAGNESDPCGISTGSERLWRGGSWINYALYCAVSCRNKCYPDYASNQIGFRLVRSANKNTITYVTEHGTTPEEIEVRNYINTSSLPTLTESGWSFMGWYTDSACTDANKVEAGYEVTQNITLYAKWEEITTPGDGFVFVEGGTVDGSGAYDRYYTGAFTVGRTVTLSSFYMSDHELTQGEYETYCCYTESTPDSIYGAGIDYPAYYVSWYDAIVYCNLRSIAEGLTPCYAMSGETDPRNWTGIYSDDNGKYSCSYTSTDSTWDSITCDMTASGYRLPTEAEWEYAARGGQETYGTSAFANYFAGATTTNYRTEENSDLDSVGWYLYNICNNGVTGSVASSGDAGYGTHEVKKKAPNALGLYDMSGNVWEWCWDWYGSISTSETVTDPCGASSDSYRLTRGGSWGSFANYCSVSYRDDGIPYYRGSFHGFRLVRSANKNTITYVTEHGTTPEEIEVRNYINTSSLPTLTESGWTFMGWYTDSACTDANKVEAGYKVTQNITLYARWEENTELEDGFVFVEGGTVVGSSAYNQYYTGAFPSGRTVNLSSFYISDHEVTQGEYETYCCYTSYSPESTYGKGADYPVYFVSWYDAIVYCNLRSMAAGLNPCYSLSGETDPTKWDGIKNSNGKYSCSYTSSNSTWDSITCNMAASGYRLPTEAEWEYAARGGQETYGTSAFANYFAGATTTDYSAEENSDLDSVGWYYYNSNKNHEVKNKASNALGLYDMSGNVSEWCWDWYGSISTSETVTDPCGASSSYYRLRRGGGWYGYANSCSVSYRNSSDPNYRYSSIGFRLVRSAE